MSTANPFKELCVLYLEDEPLIAMDTSDYLRDLGFGEVKSVQQLCSAEAAAGERAWDLAIFDINLAGDRTSIALGDSLAGRGTPVIFASGSTSEKPGLRAKGHRFISKPFSHDGLTVEIRKALNIWG